MLCDTRGIVLLPLILQKLSESFSLFSKNRYIFNIYTSRWNTQGTEFLKKTVARALKDNFVLSTELTTVKS